MNNHLGIHSRELCWNAGNSNKEAATGTGTGTRTESAPDEHKSEPSLTLFAGEVASQQRSQKMEMENLQDTLQRVRDDVVRKRKSYQNLSAERLLWERKIAVYKEDGVQSKTEIDIIKSELLALIESKRMHESMSCATGSEVCDILHEHDAGLNKMRALREKVLQLEANNDLNQRLLREQEHLKDIRQKIFEFASKTGSTDRDSCVDVNGDCAFLVREKEKLTRILLGKRRCIETEDVAISKKRIDEDAMRKRLTAQKLGLTKQIEKEERTTEELKKSYDSIRSEIENIDH